LIIDSPEAQSALLLKEQKYSQMRNIISIRNSAHEISIVNNVFESNDVVKGVLYLESTHRSHPVLIADN